MAKNFKKAPGGAKHLIKAMQDFNLTIAELGVALGVTPTGARTWG